ncbi:MAG TPA: fructose-6-phosphate aldolase [Planctomycetota bacterium]|nr:fructose-6-phosphate aldolase [Planctomycetota bacterium]
MKFFLDTANVGEIREAARLGFLDGVTTNPTLIAKEKKRFDDAIREICELCPGPVSAECVSETYDELAPEARRLAKLAPNVVVKVPLTKEGLKTVRALSAGEGIKFNVTLCFSANQGLMAAKAGASFISPFIGRLDDAGHDGMQVVRDLCLIYRNYGFKTEVLTASIRHSLHVLEAAKAGSHIATMPFAVFDKLIAHPLTDIGVARFLEDYRKIPK